LDLGAPTLAQATLAELIDGGALDRHVRRTRAEYRRRCRALHDELAQHLPEAQPTGVPAGLHVALELPDGTDESRVVEVARAAGFVAQPLSRYRLGPGPPGVVLGFAHLTPTAIRGACRSLGRQLGALTR
ncbi:hypothetical protein B7486_55165, partial [cyanobacterium TDX16]